jgi:hypothetical protein
MNAPRNIELRVVSAVAEAEQRRATLRIDAECPVPAPPPSLETESAYAQAATQRELDRLHQAATAEQLGLGQHVNWLVASQAILIHAFLMLFIISSLGVVAQNYWLMGGLALVGILCALALHGSIEQTSRTLALLVVQRRSVEVELASINGRAPCLPRDVSRSYGWTAPLFVATWILLLAASAASRL